MKIEMLSEYCRSNLISKLYMELLPVCGPVSIVRACLSRASRAKASATSLTRTGFRAGFFSTPRRESIFFGD